MAAFAPLVELTAETVPEVVCGRAASQSGLVTLDTVEHPVGVGFHLGGLGHRGAPFYLGIIILCYTVKNCNGLLTKKA